MTKGAVLHQFFSQFLPAYPASGVPTDVMFPYLTYEYKVSDFDGEDQDLTVNIWYRTESEAIPNQKATEIAKLVKENKPLVIPCDSGKVWIKQVTSITGLPDDTAPGVKRRMLNVTVKYLTHY